MKMTLAFACVAFVMTAGLTACGDSGGGSAGGTDTVTGDGGGGGGDADGSAIDFTDGDSGGEDAAPDGVGDLDVPPSDAQDVGPGGQDGGDGGGGGGEELPGADADPVDGADGAAPECAVDNECTAILGDAIVQCTRGACVDGACKVLPILSCCQSIAECEGALNLGPCEQAACVDQQCVKAPVQGCCKTNADCAGFGDGCCSESFCNLDNTCAVTVKESCCVESSDCDDGSPLTNDVCTAACVEDGCTSAPATACTQQSKPVSKNFDDGTLQLLSTLDTNLTDAVGVHTSKLRRVSGKYSVYFGDPGCETYFNGPIGEGCTLPSFSTPDNTKVVNLELRVPQFGLSDNKTYFLGFWINMAAEPAVTVGFPDGNQVLDVDWLQVVVDDGSGADVVWKSTDPDALGMGNTTGGKWLFQVANLGPYSGKAITVSFNFITDNASNFNEAPGGAPWYGVYLDDIQVSSMCDALSCDGDGDSCASDLNACTVDACTGFVIGGGGVCGYETSTPGSVCKGCGVVADCGTDTGCFDYSCKQGLCGIVQHPECCAPSSTFPAVTAPGEVALEGFEAANLAGWYVEDDLEDNITWQVTTILTYNGLRSLYFGDPATQTYVAKPANPARATAWTPVFEVPSQQYTKGVASFWLWMSTEFDASEVPPDATDTYDQLKLWVKGAGPSAVATEVWSSATAIGNSTAGQWRQIGVDLSAWAGSDVRLGFEFDSGDAPGVATANNFGGVRIDDLTVTSFCDTECLSYTDCEDEDFCTQEHCELGECISLQDDPGCCFDDADCDDDNACSVDECTDDGCVHFYDDSSATKLNCCPANDAPWVDSWTATFEDGDLGDWETLEETIPVVWHVDGTGGAGGSAASATFSDPALGTFDNGDDPASGLLISPPIKVPPLTKGTPYAQFDLLLETEWDTGDPNEFFPQFVVDDLRVSVAIDGYLIGAVQLWESHYLFNTTRGKWLRTRLDLSGYRGLEVQLVFEFDSGDDNNNDFAGPHIDNVDFHTTCLPKNAIQCLYGGDCVPSDDCKVAVCSDDFKCVESPKPTPECCEPFVQSDLTFSFEGSADGWENVDCASGGAPDDAAAVWQFTNAAGGAGIAPKVGSGMLYFGNGTQLAAPEFGSCDQILSSCVALEPDAPWTVGMWVYISAEKDFDCIGGGAPFSDQFFIYVEDCAGEQAAELVVAKFDLECNEYNKWIHLTFDVSDWAGESMRFHLSMDTWDAFVNTGKGIAVDQIEFTRGCNAVPASQ